jgi:hypothetical protein
MKSQTRLLTALLGALALGAQQQTLGVTIVNKTGIPLTAVGMQSPGRAGSLLERLKNAKIADDVIREVSDMVDLLAPHADSLTKQENQALLNQRVAQAKQALQLAKDIMAKVPGYIMKERGEQSVAIEAGKSGEINVVNPTTGKAVIVLFAPDGTRVGSAYEVEVDATFVIHANDQDITYYRCMKKRTARNGATEYLNCEELSTTKIGGGKGLGRYMVPSGDKFTPPGQYDEDDIIPLGGQTAAEKKAAEVAAKKKACVTKANKLPAKTAAQKKKRTAAVKKCNTIK